ncbi:hypothetical protein HDU79_007775 [Rhizoclosmatium sp. JEL0117]|nr:hypothetical protein HDU79_007775 [Rhizoclosmatium sp. JEL0117]
MKASLKFKSLDILDKLCYEQGADLAPCDDPIIGRYFLYSFGWLGENRVEMWFHIINVSLLLCGVSRGYPVDSPNNPYALQDEELLEIVGDELMHSDQEAMSAALTVMRERNLKIESHYIQYSGLPKLWRNDVIGSIRLALPFIDFASGRKFDGLPREALPDFVVPRYDSFDQEAVNLIVMDIICEYFVLDAAISAFTRALLKEGISENDRALLQFKLNQLNEILK